MSNYCWDEDKMKLDLATPTMMGIGDSWFWYVFRVLSHLAFFVFATH